MPRKRQRHRDNPTSSDTDLQRPILSIEDIPNSPSKWTTDYVNSLNIIYIDGSSISDVIPIVDDLPSSIDSLFLPGWDRNRFITADSDDIRQINDRAVGTIIRKVQNIIADENALSFKEQNVDAFMLSLLVYTGFDEEPCLLTPQYSYDVTIRRHKMKSKVDFMVTSDNIHMVLIVEDKAGAGGSVHNSWHETQLAGEVFLSALHAEQLSEYKRRKITYPFDIHIVRVIGTMFTFYKASITREYLDECWQRLPSDNTSLVITRFPQYTTDAGEVTFNAWDFSDEQDRKPILQTLASLRLSWTAPSSRPTPRPRALP